MSKIKNYVKDNNITNTDIVIGSDVDQNNVTKNFTVGGLKGFMLEDFQASNQDNIIKSLSFISNNTTQGVKSLTELTNLINGYTAFTVASSEIYFFKLTFQSRFYVFTFKDIGKSDYGTGQTQITESNLQIIYEKDLALDTLEEDSNTDTINLFNIGSTAINDAVNALNPPIEIQSISEGFTIFKATQDGTERSWLYQGDSGTFGLNEGQTLLSDFDLLKLESVAIENITQIPNRDYNDLQNLPALSSQENLAVTTGTETVASISATTYTGAFFDFVIKNGVNIRAGTVYAGHDGTNVEYTEISTNDLGNTSDVILSVVLSAGNIVLQATTTTNTWEIKSLVIGL